MGLILGQTIRSCQVRQGTARTPDDLDVRGDSAAPLCFCVLGSDELGRI